jgi:biopolymer transport protein ExbB
MQEPSQSRRRRSRRRAEGTPLSRRRAKGAPLSRRLAASIERYKLLAVSAGVVVLFATAALLGAEGGSEAEMQSKSWWDLFQQTGIVGILLAGLSTIGTALLIQYLLKLTPPKLGNPELLEQVEGLLNEGRADEAFEVAQADSSYASRVLAGALERRSGGYEEIKESMLESASVESFRLNAKISYLSLVGNVGPLLGLLGTVTGMISSFQVIEKLKAPTPGDLAKGVYESLVNTTLGLFIAIIFLSCYFFMKNRLADILLRINTRISTILSNAYVYEHDQGGAPV